MAHYGNDAACGNCGDEWSQLDARGLCEECSSVLDGGDALRDMAEAGE